MCCSYIHTNKKQKKSRNKNRINNREKYDKLNFTSNVSVELLFERDHLPEIEQMKAKCESFVQKRKDFFFHFPLSFAFWLRKLISGSRLNLGKKL